MPEILDKFSTYMMEKHDKNWKLKKWKLDHGELFENTHSYSFRHPWFTKI